MKKKTHLFTYKSWNGSNVNYQMENMEYSCSKEEWDLYCVEMEAIEIAGVDENLVKRLVDAARKAQKEEDARDRDEDEAGEDL